ncbi:MAG: hypothetical protein FWH36_04510 [Lentimicrobiaceae bacterium]|nr:hypothetical protein [Lentimicrobiaceae bacterium]
MFKIGLKDKKEAAANKRESAMEQKPFQKRGNRNTISRGNFLRKSLLFSLLCFMALAFSLQTMAQTNAAYSVELYTIGRKVYHLERELPKDEVRRIMANTEFLNMYNQGIKKNKNGNIWLIASCGSLVACCTWAVSIYDYGYTIGDYLGVGATGGFSVFAALMGLGAKGQGVTLIRNAVNGYSNAGKTSATELKVGFTGNGVVLVLKF